MAEVVLTGTSDSPEPCLVFADFCLFPTRRLLFKGDTEVALRGREFDLLIVLLENAGTFLTNDTLISLVWPTSTVSESNLRVQIASLRRALGDSGQAGRMIVNVTGRGYSFALPVGRERTPTLGVEPATIPHQGDELRRSSLPVRLTPLVGRDTILTKLLIHMPHRPLLTIVGPGGMGKTSIALALAQRSQDMFPDGIYFVDLAAISDQSHLASSLTKALNLRLDTYRDPMTEVLEWLSDRNALVVLDNCEHVIEAAASLATTILHRAPRVHLLCTSREALRVDDEWVHQLTPLEAPQHSAKLKADEAMAYSAVELFVERAMACRDAFTLTDDDAVHVAEICRQLDGIPLAIELAAARVDRLNVRSLAALLPDRLELLGPGKRTAKPHQQTLRATLDWSYQLLSERDRVTLNRLSIFRNGFTLEATAAVAHDDEIDEIHLADSLFELIGKSLISVEMTDDGDYYRLLETTRIFAAEKLAQAGEHADVAVRHARFCAKILLRAREEWNKREQSDWLVAYSRWMDDTIAALDWAYSSGGDVTLGIELTTLSSPLAVRLAQLEEHLERITYAVERVRELEPPNPRLELQCVGEMAYLLQHTSGDSPRLRMLTDRIAELARHFDDPEERIEANQFGFGLYFSKAAWDGALETALDLKNLAQKMGRDVVLAIANRMLSQSFHYLGRHAESIEAGDRVLSAMAAGRPARFETAARVDPRVSTRAAMSRALWLRGEFGRAGEVVHDCLAIADPYRGHPMCQALALGAVPPAIWGGDFATANTYARFITEIAAESGMDYWRVWGDCIATTLSGTTTKIEEYRLEPLILDDLYTYNRHIVTADAVARVEAGNAPWCAPEVLRADVANRLEAGAMAPERAEERLTRALELARKQEALFWQLRIANDLTVLRLEREDAGAVAALLEPILKGLQGGANVPDVKRAETLLATAV